MNRYVTYIAIISLSAILLLCASSSLASEKEQYYEPGEIVPTPVPVEVVKRAVFSDGRLSSRPDEPNEQIWGPYVDCELYPVYDENYIPIDYMILAYRERSERIGMFDMLDRIKPYVYEYMKLDYERAEIGRGEIYSNYGYLYKRDKLVEINKKLEEVSKKINNNSQYGFGFIGGIYELPPRLTQFHNGCIPGLFIFYYKALDEVKREYNTEDVEFVCFRTLGHYGSRGWEFRAGDKRLYVTVSIGPVNGGEPRGKIIIKEITAELSSLWLEKYDESYRELWKEYESDDVF